MFKPLEELHAQRDLIQKHLNWLDAQIARAEASSSEKPHSTMTGPDGITPKSATEPNATRHKTTTEPVTIESPQVVLIKPTAPIATATPTTTSIDPIHTLDQLAPAASSSSDLKRAQVGCVAIFAVATLLFLFLLFGLPYLID